MSEIHIFVEPDRNGRSFLIEDESQSEAKDRLEEETFEGLYVEYRGVLSDEISNQQGVFEI